MKMFSFMVIYYVIFVLNVFTTNAQISDKRLCANQDCTEPISLGRTLMRYGSPDSRILSFPPNEDVTIYSKSAGSRADLWGAEIKGKRGYVPRSHIREYKIFKKDVTYLVDTEDNKTSTPEVPSKNEKTKEVPTPAPVQQPYEVIDGTTIYDVVTKPSVIENSGIDNLSQQETEPLKVTQGKVVDDMVPEPIGKQSQEKVEDNVVLEKVEKQIQSEPLKTSQEKVVDDMVSEPIGKQSQEKVEENVVPEKVEKQIQSGPLKKSQEKVVDDMVSEQIEKQKDKPPVGTEKISDDDDIINKLESKDESLVKNMFSSIKGWISEGSGSDDAVEDEDEDGEEEEDGEIEDENEEYEEDESPEDLQEIDRQKNDKMNTEDDEKDTKPDITAQTSDNLKQNNVNVDTVNNKEPVNEKLDDENQKKSKNSPEKDPESSEQKELKIEESTPELSESLKEVLEENLKDAGFHDQYTTEQPNFEVPIPTEPFIEEVTPNPAETFSTSPTPEIVNIDIQPESWKKQEIKKEVDLNDIKVSEDISQENLTNPEKQDEPQFNEQSEQAVELDEKVHKDPIIVETEQKQPIPEVTNNEMEQPIEKQPDFEQEKHDSNQQLKDDSLQTKNEPESSTPPLEYTTEPPEESSGLFSGIYSSVFGNSDSLAPNDSNNDHQETLNSVDATPEKVSVVEETVLTSEKLEKKAEENIQENDEQKVEENIQEKLEETTQENIQMKPTESNEPSARDILWGSSIRKEIEEKNGKHQHDFESLVSRQPKDELSCAADPSLADCLNQDERLEHKNTNDAFSIEFPPIAYEVLTVIVIAAITIVIFLWGHMYIEKSRQEAPLIARINDLQKLFLITKKENELLMERIGQLEEDTYVNTESISNEVVQSLKDELLDAHNVRIALEEQLQNLEKELENSTEVGLELNRMLSNILSSENGSDMLVANIEQLQRQLIEQQSTINTYNENLSIKETENHELRLELEISNTKVTDLQGELNKMALNLLKIEEDKEQSQNNYEAEINSIKEQLKQNSISFKNDMTKMSEDLRIIKQKYEQAQRDLDIKTNEYILLKENIHQVAKIKNKDETLKSLLDLSSIKAELLQLRKDKEALTERLQQEIDSKGMLEKQVEISVQDTQLLKKKYDEADREKLEAQTKLEVLSNYFKEKEAQLQKELNKQESMWIEKQGEATSTIERVKYMQEELQNYKAQNESLKQEIVAQEVQMKSQISVLEKKAHENWVAARQAERKLEDAKHEAAQLRNRLTLRERNLTNDEKIQNRLQSPLEQNGELPVSPLHMTNDTAVSPPLLYGTRDHLTTSPPLPPGLPPFLPPPPGVPFMPPPLGGTPHMPLPPGFLPPPPPSMLPGDHRPPPLGRMSSPPLNSRYSPDTRAYSPYSRNSPSPTSDDDYGISSPPPPIYRGYSPYNRGEERRDFNRPLPPPIRSSTRNNTGVTHSSGSANSNESLEKLNRHNSKV